MVGPPIAAFRGASSLTTSASVEQVLGAGGARTGALDGRAVRRTLDLMCRSRAVVSLAIAAFASAIASTSRAADICAETVPANRFIDGLPAYAQCAGSMNGAVYSNNGIDTSTTSGGADWIRTQRSGGYQCTELAHRYLTFKWNIQSVPNGDAGVWCDAALPTGLVKATAPVHGDLIVLAPGSCGADATTGTRRRHRRRQRRFVGHGGPAERRQPIQVQRELRRMFPPRRRQRRQLE